MRIAGTHASNSAEFEAQTQDVYKKLQTTLKDQLEEIMKKELNIPTITQYLTTIASAQELTNKESTFAKDTQILSQKALTYITDKLTEKVTKLKSDVDTRAYLGLTRMQSLTQNIDDATELTQDKEYTKKLLEMKQTLTELEQIQREKAETSYATAQKSIDEAKTNLPKLADVTQKAVVDVVQPIVEQKLAAAKKGIQESGEVVDTEDLEAQLQILEDSYEERKKQIEGFKHMQD
jgi:hypothetical protein